MTGWRVARDAATVVALDLELTPELRLEGLARDFVRGVQEARKTAGLNVEDTIVTTYEASGELAEAIARFAAYIKAETLSEALEPGAPRAGAFGETVKVGNQPVTIGIEKVGRLAKVEADD